MNTIELYNMVQIDFMNYLAKHLDTQPSNHDIRRYIILIEPDEKTYLSPSLGEYHWHDENEVYLIHYKDEGDPMINHNGPIYYRRLLIQHPNLEKLHAFVKKHLLIVQRQMNKRLWSIIVVIEAIGNSLEPFTLNNLMKSIYPMKLNRTFNDV